MKIISPSARIMTELDQMSLARRIEVCGRICYKSEDKITADSAKKFAGGMVKNRHNSTLEMAPVTMLVVVHASNPCLIGLTKHHQMILDLFEVCPKYLVVDSLGGSRYLVSGTIRAFRELVMEHRGCELGWIMAAELWASGLFNDITPPEFGMSTDVSARKFSLGEIDALPPGLHLRHRQVSAKFIVNRAVTHEIVRHRPCSYLQESQRYCRYDQDQFGNEVTFIKPMFFSEDSEEYRLWQQAMEQTERIYLKLLETSSPQAARTVLPNSCKTEIIMQANLVEWEHFFHLRCSEAAEPSMREVTIPLREMFCRMFPQHSFDRRMPEGWVEKTVQ